MLSDATYEFLDIPVDTHVITLPFYAGVGAKLSIHDGSGDETEFGIRIPVGLAVQWTEYPVEVFAEIAPGIDITPSSEFDLMGGIGARFYF